jgi:hypothetical protein
MDFAETAILSILKIVSDYFVRKSPDVLELVAEHRRIAEFESPAVFKR